MSVRLLTPPGRGGVSILELRGSRSLAALAQLSGRARIESKSEGESSGPRLVSLRAGGELIDEAVLVVRSAECVELGLHGSPAVVRRVARELERAGAPALESSAGRACAGSSPGSIEHRAWEAASRAATERGARRLLDIASGELRAELESGMLLPPAEWRALIEACLQRGASLRGLLTPLRVVLAGPANAGKSTLFNLLVGRERVVVSPEAGTTRDAIEERVQLGPFAVDLVDTAGEREVAPGPERDGQALGRLRRAQADLVLWLHPASDSEAVPRPGDSDFGPVRRVLDSRAGGAAGDLQRPLRVVEEPEAARAQVERLLLEVIGDPAAAAAGPGVDGAGRSWPGELFGLGDAQAHAALAALADLAECDRRCLAVGELLGAWRGAAGP